MSRPLTSKQELSLEVITFMQDPTPVWSDHAMGAIEDAETRDGGSNLSSETVTVDSQEELEIGRRCMGYILDPTILHDVQYPKIWTRRVDGYNFPEVILSRSCDQY